MCGARDANISESSVPLLHCHNVSRTTTTTPFNTPSTMPNPQLSAVPAAQATKRKNAPRDDEDDDGASDSGSDVVGGHGALNNVLTFSP